ncbi:MAG: TerB family tellurite resistance protein [Cyclobacteriaceae bacterium]|nr:TerB family tellurite resistance protein [Cyclobacteriaceae bacterium]
MTLTQKKTNYYAGLVSLYHLLINADGHVDDKELKMGQLMKKHENMDDWEFNYRLRKVAEKKKEDLITECVESLKKCDNELKIRCIAWMSLIANSDGFMAPEEWKLIYKIYNTELNLNLADILAMQKKLPRSN